MGWKVIDIKARLHKMKVVTVEEMDKYIDEIDDKIEFNRPIYTPLGKNPIEKGTYDSVQFDSKWEAAFYIYFKEIKGCVVERNHEDYLMYLDTDGKERKFYYDFTVNGVKSEVKGRFRPSDLEKMRQCQEVKFYSAEEMKPIMKAVSEYKPNWRSEYLPRA